MSREELTLRAQFIRQFYPKPGAALSSDGFMICLYRLTRIEEGDKAACPVSAGATFTAKGHFLPAVEKVGATLTGSWGKDKDGRLTFSVTASAYSPEENKNGIIAMLSSGLVKGIGRKTAERIYAKFGNSALKVMDSDIGRLSEVPGIGKRTLKKIEASWKEVSNDREMVTLLAGAGLSVKAALDASARGFTPEQVKADPWCVAGLYRVGFPAADRLAESLGAPMNSASRLVAATDWALMKNERSTGSAGMADADLCRSVLALLNGRKGAPPVTGAAFSERLIAMARDGTVVHFKGFTYRASAYHDECVVAENVARLLKEPAPCPSREKLGTMLKAWEEKEGVALDPVQEKAVMTAVSSGVSVITGGPGRGKTTVIKAVVALRRQLGGQTVLMAPTGRAARRMSAATGAYASTIHSALGLGKDNEGGARASIPAGQLVVDEISMMDTWLAATLLEAVEARCSVTLVGDPDQLPSVGTGAVLRDLIASGSVPTVTLEKIYRQEGGSVIVDNCEKIRVGDPGLILDAKRGFPCYAARSGKDAAKAMTWLYLQKVKEYGADEVALLSPYHHAASDASTDSVNAAIQTACNPPGAGKAETSRRGRLFREGDRVMQTVNKDDVCNGDVGIVESIRDDEDGDVCVTVSYPDAGTSREYSADELDEIELAYCMTYHKSQGSEYKCVIAAVIDEHSGMLQRNLLYTGVSRAKEECVVVGTLSAVQKAVRKSAPSMRKTLLKEKLQKLIPPAGKTDKQ